MSFESNNAAYHHVDTDDDDWSVVVVNSDEDDGSSAAAVAGGDLIGDHRSDKDRDDERSRKSSAAVDEDELMDLKRSALLIRKKEIEDELKDINQALCAGESSDQQPASKDSKALFIRRLREGASSSKKDGEMVKSWQSRKRKRPQLGNYMDDDEEDSEKTRSDAETGSVDFGAPSAARDEKSKAMHKRNNGNTPMLCQPPRCHRVTLIPNTSKNTVIDLNGVPPQPPIPKRANRIKDGYSKYAGVCFDKTKKKWYSRISIDGRQQYVGFYDNEEVAAADYARALLKYNGPEALEVARERNLSGYVFDLSDVPPQRPIPKKAGRIKEGASKYSGVSFHKVRKKWQAIMCIDGYSRYIGLYENEEEAAADYARALLKYRGSEALVQARRQNSSERAIDFSGVPPQRPIPKKAGRIKEGASKYIGVYFCKRSKKWAAQIRIDDGKNLQIGYYENEEEAAADYARALLKYRGEDALNKARERNLSRDL